MVARIFFLPASLNQPLAYKGRRFPRAEDVDVAGIPSLVPDGHAERALNRERARQEDLQRETNLGFSVFPFQKKQDMHKEASARIECKKRFQHQHDDSTYRQKAKTTKATTKPL